MLKYEAVNAITKGGGKTVGTDRRISVPVGLVYFLQKWK